MHLSISGWEMLWNTRVIATPPLTCVIPDLVSLTGKKITCAVASIGNHPSLPNSGAQIAII